MNIINYSNPKAESDAAFLSFKNAKKSTNKESFKQLETIHEHQWTFAETMKIKRSNEDWFSLINGIYSLPEEVTILTGKTILKESVPEDDDVYHLFCIAKKILDMPEVKKIISLNHLQRNLAKEVGDSNSIEDVLKLQNTFRKKYGKMIEDAGLLKLKFGSTIEEICAKAKIILP